MRRGSVAFALLALALISEPADAQPTRPTTRHPARPVIKPRPTRPRIKPRPPSQARTVFTGRLGLGVARKLLESSSTSDRQRALERLGAVGTAGALELLAKSLEPGGAAKTSEERLVAVRALAAHATNPDVRLALVRALAGVGATGGNQDRIEQWVRETAALALARSRRREALDLLSKALRQEGPVADAAAIGIEAHPPADIRPVIDARGSPTLALIRLLSRLGDQRAFHALRRFVKRGAPEVRAEAAVALTRLGDFETVSLARHWMQHETAAATRVAAARILAMARDPAAEKAIANLLADADHWRAGLEIALEAAQPAVVPALERQLAAHPDDAGEILSAIGRAGGEPAAAVLVRELGKPERGALAAYALALSPGDAASEALERALSAGSAHARRNAARASVIRTRALGASVSGLSDALERLVSSTDAADRAAGAWGRAALDSDSARELLGAKDPNAVRAAARQAFSAEVAPSAARRLVRERDPSLRTALAASLAVPGAASEVPTSVLLELLDDASAATPIAAQALAARDVLDLRPRIEPLLANADALVRASTALGLAESREPSSVGLLERAYRFETDPVVRHAIVVALSRRTERTRARVLALAADLDAHRGVREAARLARSGHRLSRLGSGRATLWLQLVPNQSDVPASSHGVELSTAPGVVLPLLPDPDGAITLTGLPPGSVRLRLAAAADSDKASSSNGTGRAQTR